MLGGDSQVKGVGNDKWVQGGEVENKCLCARHTSATVNPDTPGFSPDTPGQPNLEVPD